MRNKIFGLLTMVSFLATMAGYSKFLISVFDKKSSSSELCYGLTLLILGLSGLFWGWIKNKDDYHSIPLYACAFFALMQVPLTVIHGVHYGSAIYEGFTKQAYFVASSIFILGVVSFELGRYTERDSHW